MICYKDRAWCKESLGDPSNRCTNYSCDRNLSPEERDRAIKWWGSTNFPVSVVNFKTEGCGYVSINKQS